MCNVTYIFTLQITDFAKYRFSSRNIQIFIPPNTDSHFANYRCRKIRIFTSQFNKDFAKHRFSFRFVNYSKRFFFIDSVCLNFLKLVVRPPAKLLLLSLTLVCLFFERPLPWKWKPFSALLLAYSLRSADVFPVAASLPPSLLLGR